VQFEQFAADALPRLVRFAAAMCADRALAEDVVQEVLIRVHARWDHIGSLDAPEAYVRRALVNEYVSWRRKWARVLPREHLPDDTEPDHGDRIADRSATAQRLAELPPKQRAVLVLRYLDDLTDSEIAAALGCRPATVRAYAARGLASLRESTPKDDHVH
jgi:RNA polymerase sigma-70 factor (sigma-E family)